MAALIVSGLSDSDMYMHGPQPSRAPAYWEAYDAADRSGQEALLAGYLALNYKKNELENWLETLTRPEA